MSGFPLSNSVKTNPLTENMTVIGGGTTTTNSLIYSNDGVKFNISPNGVTSATSRKISTVRGIAWNGLIWVAVGSTIVYSSDGITWNTATISPSPSSPISFSSVCWNGTQWLASTDATSATLYSSSDGITWLISSSLSFSINAIEWTGSEWVVVGSQIRYSTDAISWQQISTSVPGPFFSVCSNSNTTIIVGDKTIGTYLNRVFTPVANTNNPFSTGKCNTVAWNGSLWVAGGTVTIQNKPDILAYSKDGITWRIAPSASRFQMTECKYVSWNGTYWVAVGTGVTAALFSVDGIGWVPLLSKNDLITNALCVCTRRVLPFVGLSLIHI